MIEVILQLGLGFVALCAFIVYIYLQVPTTYRLKFLAIPLFFALACAYVVEVPQILGLPKETYPEKQFSLIAFKVVFISEKPFIEAWIIEHGRSRLYRFPYTEDVADQLRKMAAAGGGLSGRFKEGHQGHGGVMGAEELSTIEIPQEPMPRKSQ